MYGMRFWWATALLIDHAWEILKRVLRLKKTIQKIKKEKKTKQYFLIILHSHVY